MLSPEALEAIKNQTASTPKSQVIFIEIGNGYSYGSVSVEFEDDGNIIKADLESKGFTVKSKVKAYR